MRHIAYSRGQILIETIVALSMLVLVLAAVAVVVVVAVSTSSFVKSQSLANKYAQEGMEYVRLKRDRDFTSFLAFSSGNGWCMGENKQIVLGSGDCGINIAAQFSREVEIYQSGNPGAVDCNTGSAVSQAKVIVRVRWTSPKCPTAGTLKDRYCHKVEVSSCFATPTSGA